MPRGAQCDGSRCLQIAECNVESLQQALLSAMNAGLVPDGKEAAIVPFKGKATLIPMIEGRRKLAQQASKGLVLRSMAVYEGDEWDYAEGLHERLDHVPNPSASHAPEDLIYVYATARLPGAVDKQYDVMSRATVDRYRAFSARADKPPWTTHFEEMAKNAVEKRLSEAAAQVQPCAGRGRRSSSGWTLWRTRRPWADTPTGETVDTTTGEIMDGERACAAEQDPSQSQGPVPGSRGSPGQA